MKEDGLVNCCNAEEFYDELEACTTRWEAMLRSIREEAGNNSNTYGPILTLKVQLSQAVAPPVQPREVPS